MEFEIELSEEASNEILKRARILSEEYIKSEKTIIDSAAYIFFRITS